jgi:guanyl-specific ribonuclease Sa
MPAFQRHLATRCGILALAMLGSLLCGCGDPAPEARRASGPVSVRDAKVGEPSALPAGVPDKVRKVLRSIDEHDSAPPGYEGGRPFYNNENLLPRKDAHGRSIHYREWDVNPKRAGVNRGPQRLVTGSDGSAYYTSDHYQTFVKIR